MLRIILLGATLLGAQRIEDNCVNRERQTCVLASSRAYLEDFPCSGWCAETKQCLGREAFMCPLEDMPNTDYGFVSSTRWTAPQCAAIVQWGRAGLGVAVTIEGWCQPKSEPNDFAKGHCSEMPIRCNTTNFDLLTSLNQIPCAQRFACFDCLAVQNAATDPACEWCESSGTCGDSGLACPETAFTITGQCPNANRYREKALKKRKAIEV
eukprot:Gregarina_sp_Poly_1__8197@NODE_475_length_8096_cov_496_560966_g384_i0_p5_GENE_NODE_475_length_8096_cov_496_560966_g384_i0NODE_475_length_8096_cov_496_560966_g384_i0_p5_ORF_typecomplete_len210_score25_63PSI/PF01437_25/5_1PSI/PF01437_25/6_2e02PSI/PF01437_25/0_00032_NODE_475_length_8096_cov_496_560966_g384_i09831612